jgi:hypothetical protein
MEAQNFVAALAAAIGGQLVTQAQLEIAIAPLATQAQLNATHAATQAQLNAMQLQIAGTQAQLNAMQAQIADIPAQIQALLLPHNAPAIAAAAAANVQSIVAARMRNAHDRNDEYVVVPRADGTPPPSWPDGFNRIRLGGGNIQAINRLLIDYGIPHGNLAPLIRRNLLAEHIGTARF